MNRIQKYFSPRNQMFIPLFAIFSLFGNGGCTDKDNQTTPVITPIQDKGWAFETTPVWSDEFDVAGTPDPSKWTFETGGGGWGNNELQYYTKGDNARIANGILTIEARKEDLSGSAYTSTRMISRGKGDWLYGRFEAKMKLPTGRGTWPAFWMLPTDISYGNWPKSGEIDIMEHVGYDLGNVHASIHTEAYNHKIDTEKTSTKFVSTAATEFHVYRLDWTPYAVRGYVDDEKIFEFVNGNTGFTTWPFNKQFFMLLNLAVGGEWGGALGIDNTIFPAKLEVDYVRVFKLVN